MEIVGSKTLALLDSLPIVKHPGRPFGTTKEGTRRKKIVTRVNDDELGIIQDNAYTAGMDLSAYIRGLALKGEK